MKTKVFKALVLFLIVTSMAIQETKAMSLLDNSILYQVETIASSFSHPLGYENHILYTPRQTYDNNNALIEDTDYGAKNPDLDNPDTCFNLDWRELFHAGEDLYYPNRETDSAGHEVTAVANGTVIEVTPDGWPGRGIIIEHTLSSGEKIYSVYLHVDSVQVSSGDVVTEGQVLGYIIYQSYSGLFPQYHQDSLGNVISDSHLHFEIRYFPDARTIYSEYPECNYDDGVGRGYTHPDVYPDNFPITGQGYTDPTDFINNFSSNSSTPTPTLPPSQTTNSSITQGSNDGGINPTPCEFTLEDNEVYLGACFDGGDITSGFRFENIQVPRNANIESAYVRFTVDGEYTTPIQVQINGEASGNPLIYSEASPPTNRVKTYNSALWNITETWNLGEQYNTPDLSAIIREIVIRDDWNPGQPISLIISNAGSTDVRRVIGFERAEGDPDLETAELIITYNTNPTPTPTSQPPNSTPLPTSTPIIIQPTFTPLPVT